MLALTTAGCGLVLNAVPTVRGMAYMTAAQCDIPEQISEWGCDVKLWDVMPRGGRRDLERYARDGKEELARSRIVTLREVAALADDTGLGESEAAATAAMKKAAASKAASKAAEETAAEEAVAEAMKARLQEMQTDGEVVVAQRAEMQAAYSAAVAKAAEEAAKTLQAKLQEMKAQGEAAVAQRAEMQAAYMKAAEKAAAAAKEAAARAAPPPVGFEWGGIY